MELNKINSSMTNWGAEAANLNENFDKVSTAIEQVKNATIKNKGYFSSESYLKSAYPQASKGDKAYVGGAYPYHIWIWNGSSWSDSGSVGGEESVNLGDYHTKEYTDAKFSELGLLPIKVSKYAVQTHVWYGANNTHIVIPVSEGDLISYNNKNSVMYYALLTAYTIPVENETPSFVTGYEGRQYTTTGFTIPSGTKFLVINNPFYSGNEITSLKINGFEILNGVYPYIFKSAVNSFIGIDNNAFAICYTVREIASKNIATAWFYNLVKSNNIRLLVKFTNNNSADNATLNTQIGEYPLYYRGERASSTNSWNAGDVLDIRFDATDEFWYAEPWNGVAMSTELEEIKQKAIKEADLGYVIASNNIANPDNIENGLINSNGEHFLLVDDPWNMIKIPVIPGQIITFGGFYLGRTAYYAFYNDSTLVSFAQFNDPNGIQRPTTVTVPAGANILYIDISTNQSPSNPFEHLQVNIGSTLSSYDEFEQRISSIKGTELIGGGSGDDLMTLIVDLPVSDGSNISSGYAYIDSTDRSVKVKA